MHRFEIELPGYTEKFLMQMPQATVDAIIAASKADDWGTVCPVINTDNSVGWEFVERQNFSPHWAHYSKMADSAVRSYIHALWTENSPR